MSKIEQVRNNWIEILKLINSGKSYEEIVKTFERKNIYFDIRSLEKVKKEYDKLYEKEAEKEAKLREYEKQTNEELMKKIRKLEKKMIEFEEKTNKKIIEIEYELAPEDKQDTSSDDYLEKTFKKPYRNSVLKENATFRIPKECRDILKKYCGNGIGKEKENGLLNISRNEFITGLILEFDKTFKKNQEDI